MTPRDDDLSLPPAIEARLRSIDDALPPTPPWHPPTEEPRPLRVAGVRPASRGPSAAVLLVVLAAVVVAGVWLGRQPAVVPGSGDASASATAGASAPAASDGPTAPAGTTAPGRPVVEVLRGADDGDSLYARRNGCGSLVGADAATAIVFDGDDVDRAAAETGVDAGWLEVTAEGGQAVRVWLGTDPVALAVDAATPLAVIGGRGDVWLGSTERVGRWVSLTTPAGRVAWWQTGNSVAAAEGCAPARVTPVAFGGLRSITCGRLSLDACKSALDVARGAAPEAFGPDVDVVAESSCGPNNRCAAGATVDIAAVPAGWTGLDDVRAFEVGDPLLMFVVRETTADALPAHVLALVGRPSLPLPTFAAPSTGACRLARREGALQGSPWDERVAWVGTSAVRWPFGFTARFVPDLELVSPDGAVIAREGDSVVLGGGWTTEDRPTFGACSVNG
ncbi:MAG: hypothetical protein AB1627_10780 [Chloroflexota bacterium]